MSDAIAPIVGDTDDPSAGGGNGVASPAPRKATAKPSSLQQSSRLEHLKISTIRQHYYPEGGWGWVICACAFAVNALTAGLLLSYGVLKREVVKRFGEEHEDQAEWLGPLSVSLGLFLSPLIVAFCRRKSTRLTAVFGGLTAALGCLFTSFASQMHQVFLSYGFVMALGLSLARVTSSLMIGQYFKRRREKVEIIVTSGTGCGVIVFSYSFAKIIRSLEWRIGLQAVTGLAVVPFFVGICYRSASLYHPQRRAILHLKNQRKKVKDKSGGGKPPFFDFSPLRSGALLACMLAAALAAFALYAPFFHMVSLATAEGLVEGEQLQLQAHLGAAWSAGCALFGLLAVRRSADCLVGRAPLCQGALLGLAVACAALQAAQGFRALLLFCWLFGVPCGGLHYCLRMLVFEKVRAKSFARAWAYVEMAQSVPALVGPPVVGYMNGNSPRSGYYLAAGCFLAAAAALLLTRLSTSHPLGRRRGQGGSCSTCASQTPSCCCTQEFNLMQSQQGSSSGGGGHAKCQKTISFSDTVDVADDHHPQDPEEEEEEEEGNVDFENLDIDDNVVICYDNGRPSGTVVVEEQRKVLHRYGCGHLEEELTDAEMVPPPPPPSTKRQMTIIEEVTSSV